ncbi:MAG: methylated-DNA--[protein]-cysteine S-methyltransferase [Solobacterium sp.]|jgi:methylated-DNA-[protein]-cysteine S-methyltransferase|nr:methylated-DNA--[protein]-cysteine S-methyltransferase [Solobacterium sp.]MCH4222345.1 methylated-DNA--[protein]-cysteine S-methyltransferase [Solobacterium sp.]MCH4265514.1 methylated-DNA--[protein]-cysteine S-methyltransferase [Solobacterium sp.]
MSELDRLHFCTMESPVGPLRIEEDGMGITAVTYLDAGERVGIAPRGALQKQAVKELEQYFKGTRKEFDLPLSMKGTEFQLDDWTALMQIPYGETCSYQDIAIAIGKPNACRAVGMANHVNPISIIVPCHRVIGKNGRPAGYGGGLEKQAYLLELEKNNK